MTTRTAIDLLVLTVVVANLILSYGLMRKIRFGTGPRIDLSLPPVSPTAGHIVNPGRDNEAWPDELSAILADTALVILAVPGCPGCETVKRELAASAFSRASTWVLVEPAFADSDAEAYLETWPLDLNRMVAPDQFELMASLGNPRGYPVVMVIRNGVVTASAYRLRDLGASLEAATSEGRPEVAH